jgi:ectoine hydroxylase-related dioxygenase (phytanoyl-CoA dioxygenase family)
MASIKNFFEAEGYAVIRQVYTQEQVDEINREYNKVWFDLLRRGEIVQKTNNPLGSLFPRLHDYHQKNENISKITLNPDIFKILEELLGEEALLISGNYIYKEPGSGGSACHQDNYSIGASPGTTYSAFVCLDKHDKENGCLFFVRGTQNWELQPIDLDNGEVVKHFSDSGQEILIPKGCEMVHVETDPGDVVIFNGNVLHGSGPNVSPYRYRRSLLMFFAAASLERITMNYNLLINKNGERVRRRLNTNPKITENKSVFLFKEGDYYANNGWR